MKLLFLIKANCITLSLVSLKRNIRRNKDFVKCIFKCEPTCLGDTVHIGGNRDITNNK